MENVECLRCGEVFDCEFPYSDGIECPKCGCKMETDWEEVEADSMIAWVVGEAEDEQT